MFPSPSKSASKISSYKACYKSLSEDKIKDYLGFLRRQLFPESLEDVGEVRNGDEAVTLPVKDPEGLPDLLLNVVVMDLPGAK